MAEKLSEAQRRALAKMEEGGAWSSYEARAGLGTMNSLARRGYATKSQGLGSMAFPRTSIKFRITDAGRAALKERG